MTFDLVRLDRFTLLLDSKQKHTYSKGIYKIDKEKTE